MIAAFVVGGFVMLALGFFLCGIAAVKEAFWPVPARGVQVGNIAVVERPRTDA